MIPHPLAGRTVLIPVAWPDDGRPVLQAEAQVLNWWLNIGGNASWMHCYSNEECRAYADRVSARKLPRDDNAVVVMIADKNVLVHDSEIILPEVTAAAIRDNRPPAWRIAGESGSPAGNELLLEATDGDDATVRLAYRIAHKARPRKPKAAPSIATT